MPTAEKTKPIEYQYGDKSPNKEEPWKAMYQVFSALTLTKTDQSRLFGEFMTVEFKGVPVAFVDLVQGIVVPFASVAFAEPV
jgi:hypothetical protein